MSVGVQHIAPATTQFINLIITMLPPVLRGAMYCARAVIRDYAPLLKVIRHHDATPKNGINEN